MGLKDILRGLIPLLTWPVLLIISLIIGVKVTPFALIVMVILFLAIIPIDRVTPWCNTEPHATIKQGKRGYAIARI